MDRRPPRLVRATYVQLPEGGNMKTVVITVAAPVVAAPVVA